MSVHWDPSTASCLQLVDRLCARICPHGLAWEDRDQQRRKLVQGAFTILLNQSEVRCSNADCTCVWTVHVTCHATCCHMQVPYPHVDEEQRGAHNAHRVAQVRKANIRCRMHMVHMYSTP